ncbi:hypothetical protein [Pseudomonas sp. GL-B-19]|nr:hypothetical protein [Pseudomonas sp. GL-B-19]
MELKKKPEGLPAWWAGSSGFFAYEMLFSRFSGGAVLAGVRGAD